MSAGTEADVLIFSKPTPPVAESLETGKCDRSRRGFPLRGDQKVFRRQELFRPVSL